MSSIQIYSEIGRLRKVLLKRPTKELENLTPDNMQTLLFDDIPDLELAQQEHDHFAEVFRQNDIEVLYLDDLLCDVLEQGKERREQFVEEYLPEAGIFGERAKLFQEYLLAKRPQELVTALLSGIRISDMPELRGKHLATIVERDSDLLIDPMPNLYFQRDPMTTIGTGVTINAMATRTRRRETLIDKFIFDYHPDFTDVPKYYERENRYRIEGGDILILSAEVVAVGISQRTEPEAIEILANRLLTGENSFKHILAFKIPQKRAFMHLDTVFTMVDRNIFTVHPEVESPLRVYDCTLVDGKLRVELINQALPEILKRYLELDDIKLIRCGGDSLIDAAREQWNDGSNTLAIAPGEVIVYPRNHVTNRLLQEAGVKIHTIPSSELSRGRGGPRCMSMPLYRDLLD